MCCCDTVLEGCEPATEVERSIWLLVCWWRQIVVGTTPLLKNCTATSAAPVRSSARHSSRVDELLMAVTKKRYKHRTQFLVPLGNFKENMSVMNVCVCVCVCQIINNLWEPLHVYVILKCVLLFVTSCSQSNSSKETCVSSDLTKEHTDTLCLSTTEWGALLFVIVLLFANSTGIPF